MERLSSFVGYLEEEAVKTYTDILGAIDGGHSISHTHLARHCHRDGSALSLSHSLTVLPRIDRAVAWAEMTPNGEQARWHTGEQRRLPRSASRIGTSGTVPPPLVLQQARARPLIEPVVRAG